jgi:TPP-dependent pyruvate/acetoin dehydrogenase alpha subunit
MTKPKLIQFEKKLAKLWEKGNIHCPVHFCGGNEDQLISYFKGVDNKNDWVFSTWRNHYHWLLKTGDEKFLLNKILKENNSMHIIDLKRKFISSGIVCGTCNMAVGVAYALKLAGKPYHVHVFIGDGGCDQGLFFEALRYSIGQNLPITFICENNNRSVETTVEERWGEGDFMMEGLKQGIPKTYYYEYTPTYKHVGTGRPVEW